jgi:hypothetical protein
MMFVELFGVVVVVSTRGKHIYRLKCGNIPHFWRLKTRTELVVSVGRWRLQCWSEAPACSRCRRDGAGGISVFGASQIAI